MIGFSRNQRAGCRVSAYLAIQHPETVRHLDKHATVAKDRSRAIERLPSQVNLANVCPFASLTSIGPSGCTLKQNLSVAARDHWGQTFLSCH